MRRVRSNSNQLSSLHHRTRTEGCYYWTVWPGDAYLSSFPTSLKAPARMRKGQVCNKILSVAVREPRPALHYTVATFIPPLPIQKVPMRVLNKPPSTDLALDAVPTFSQHLDHRQSSPRSIVQPPFSGNGQENQQLQVVDDVINRTVRDLQRHQVLPKREYSKSFSYEGAIIPRVSVGLQE
ncbi:hypothetical protein CPC08DRAFT_753645 [Agrocybe pediades]|nr:hypothetical protein CPC08DRAFT_753645 [Agrocybe pediades]